MRYLYYSTILLVLILLGGCGIPFVMAGQPDDFWLELKNQFSLQYSGASDPGFSRYQQSFAKQEYFDRLSSRGYWFMPYVLEQVQKRGMPAEIVLLPAIESAYRSDAVSRSRAVGMWQIIAPHCKTLWSEAGFVDGWQA